MSIIKYEVFHWYTEWDIYYFESERKYSFWPECKFQSLPGSEKFHCPVGSHLNWDHSTWKNL